MMQILYYIMHANDEIPDYIDNTKEITYQPLLIYLFNFLWQLKLFNCNTSELLILLYKIVMIKYVNIDISRYK